MDGQFGLPLPRGKFGPAFEGWTFASEEVAFGVLAKWTPEIQAEGTA